MTLNDYAGCHYAEWRLCCVSQSIMLIVTIKSIMLIVIMLIVIMLIVIVLIVIMLIDIMLIVIMLNVMAPMQQATGRTQVFLVLQS